MEKITSWGTS